MKIALDAMGGDYAPAEVVKGAAEACTKYGISTILVGDRARIESEMQSLGMDTAGLEIKHASDVVGMDEHPASAIRRKADSSIVVAADLVSGGEAQAMVSAGNTGAAMAVAALKVGRIPGVDRPGIASFLPTMNGKCILLDAGANVDCSVENLLQFAVMGSEYAKSALKVENPRVGLLSIGEEPTKGDELTKAANARLAQMSLNFVGNVEGKEIFRGAADVIVCDGFAGNIVLKSAEGVIELIVKVLKSELAARSLTEAVAPALQALMCKVDYAEYGGAPLLGVNGVCIISHGRSDSRAIRNAIRAAADAVENDAVGCIRKAFSSRA
jgi:phosphate acyltransferase